MDERKEFDGDSQETRRAFRDYDLADSVANKTPWQIWRDACAYQARAALAATQARQEPVAYVYEHYKYPQSYTRTVAFEETAYAHDFVCRPLVYAAPVLETATQAEQDRLSFLDDDEIVEAANKFRLGNPRMDTLRGFVNYVIITARHKEKK